MDLPPKGSDLSCCLPYPLHLYWAHLSWGIQTIYKVLFPETCSSLCCLWTQANPSAVALITCIIASFQVCHPFYLNIFPKRFSLMDSFQSHLCISTDCWDYMFTNLLMRWKDACQSCSTKGREFSWPVDHSLRSDLPSDLHFALHSIDNHQ